MVGNCWEAPLFAVKLIASSCRSSSLPCSDIPESTLEYSGCLSPTEMNAATPEQNAA